LKAHKAGETFRVFILMPLLPAFEGDVSGDSGTGMRTIMHYQYQSISRGCHSLIQRLQEEGVENWKDFIGFYSLRSYDMLQGVPVSELVYIHSKLLIADDQVVICGSANINDRSLLGDRDSEVCLHITDRAFTTGRMNGESVKCGRFAGSLRKHLFREHLGLLETTDLDVDITDPTSDSFFHGVWNATASKNTHLFEELFSVIPTNSIHTRKASKEFQMKTRPLAETFGRDVHQRLAAIRGRLVHFPTDYLRDEDLQPAKLAKEAMVPAELWK